MTATDEEAAPPRPAADREPASPRHAAWERRAAITAVLLFSIALGVASLALPLLALGAGYGEVAVGVLTATSAISQFLFRLRLPALLGRYPDRALIALACFMIAASYASLLISTALPVFLVAQLLQGGARALFWTASQTHAVRTPGKPMRMLAQVGAVGNIGAMLGPLVTGFVATFSVLAALVFGAILASIAGAIALLLTRFDPYERRKRTGEPRMWRQPGVDVACWAGFAGGGWRALMSSYVPVVLTVAGLPPGIVGILQSAGDLSGTLLTFGLFWIPPRMTRLALEVAVVAAAAGMAALPFAGDNIALAAAVLMVSGAGASPLNVLGAAAARQLVHPADEGEAIALVGTFRAIALFATPAGVAATLGVLGVGTALTMAGLLLGLPAIAISIWRRL